MILLEMKTKSGALYTANVVNKKLRRIGPKDAPDKKPEWLPYKELRSGAVGEKLVIVWPDDSLGCTTVVERVAFPEVE